jgi:tetratricopeptide (TPR) repeat protein
MKISSLRWVGLRQIFAAIILSSCLAFAVAPQTAKPEPQGPNRGLAYYHYSLAHMYQELAMAYNRQDYVVKAIDHLRQAMKFDPTSSFLPVELAQMYWDTGRTTDAISECQDLIKRNPSNLEARRLLGHIFVRNLTEMNQGQSQTPRRNAPNNEVMMKQAVDQFQKITELDPKDVESLIVLGRLYSVSNESLKAEEAFKKALAIEPDNDEALVTLAGLYSDHGQTKQAAELLERASAHNQHPRLLAMLGKSYEDNRDYAKAVEVLRRALEQDKDNAELKSMLAQNLMKTDQLDEALKLLQEVAAADPQDPGTFLNLGKIYREKGQYPKALDSFKKAQALQPDSLDITYNLALLHETQGSYEEAIRLLKKLLDDTAHPDNTPYTTREKANRAIFLERLAYIYRVQEKYKESETAYRQMIDMDPENGPHGYIELMITLRQAHQYQRAKSEADAAVKRFPDDKQLHMARATLVADMGDVEQGVKEMKALLPTKKPAEGEEEKDADDRREIYSSLAQLYEHARRFDDAFQAIQEAEKLATGKEQKELVYFLWGAIYERAKKVDEAELQFRRALALNPDSSMTLNYLGYMLADHGLRLDEAVKMITRALEIEPQSGAYMDSLGWAYFKQNRFDLAEQYLVKASQKQPTDPTIKDHLADLYIKTNRTKDAMREWTTALSEWEKSLPGDTDPVDIAKVQKKLEDAKVRLAKEGR